jgi:hypothetical protein
MSVESHRVDGDVMTLDRHRPSRRPFCKSRRDCTWDDCPLRGQADCQSWHPSHKCWRHAELTWSSSQRDAPPGPKALSKRRSGTTPSIDAGANVVAARWDFSRDALRTSTGALLSRQSVDCKFATHSDGVSAAPALVQRAPRLRGHAWSPYSPFWIRRLCPGSTLGLGP